MSRPTSRSTHAPPVVTLDGCTKSYRRGRETVHAVEDISLTLHRHELVALVGPSGSGKTTLLNLLAGWEIPDHGRIVRRGRSVSGSRAPAWRDVAVLPQRLGLVADLTIAENVLLPVWLAPDVADTVAPPARLCDRLMLTGLLDRLPHELSLGEQQRAALARAAVVGSALLLADEPTGHQDDASLARVLDVLAAAAVSGCVVVATHAEEVQARATRVLTMADGRITGDVRR